MAVFRGKMLEAIRQAYAREAQGNRILSCSGEHREQVVFVETA